MELVVFDVETDRLLDGSRQNHSDLRVTVAAAINMRVDVGDGSREVGPVRTFYGDEAVALDALDALDASGTMAGLGDMLEGADAIVAYNGRSFDLRVLRNHLPSEDVDRWERKLVDPFEAIRKTTGSWVKLDELLEANGLARKSADGVMAVEWWASGEKAQRARVAEYCRDDVRGLVALLSLGRFAFPEKSWRRVLVPSPSPSPPPPPPHSRWKMQMAVTGWCELDWDSYLSAHAMGRRVLGAACRQPSSALPPPSL